VDDCEKKYGGAQDTAGRSRIVTDKREELSINYKLHSVNNEWRVYDLVIEDISLVNNYRSQFDRVIARSSQLGQALQRDQGT
jgi:ABC-type transporter MlaC component